VLKTAETKPRVFAEVNARRVATNMRHHLGFHWFN